MRGRHREADPSLAGPLEERGLLRILEPKEWIDAEVAEKLAEVMVDLLAGGVFDHLPEAPYFAELSQSRIGYGADLELAEFLTAELRQRGLARPSEDEVSIPLHPVVRTTILVILGQLARGAGERRGMVLHPATNWPTAASDLIEALSRESMPSCEGVVKLDLEPVTLDLSSIPLEEVPSCARNTGTLTRRTCEVSAASWSSWDGSATPRSGRQSWCSGGRRSRTWRTTTDGRLGGLSARAWRRGRWDWREASGPQRPATCWARLSGRSG